MRAKKNGDPSIPKEQWLALSSVHNDFAMQVADVLEAGRSSARMSAGSHAEMIRAMSEHLEALKVLMEEQLLQAEACHQLAKRSRPGRPASSNGQVGRNRLLDLLNGRATPKKKLRGRPRGSGNSIVASEMFESVQSIRRDSSLTVRGAILEFWRAKNASSGSARFKGGEAERKSLENQYYAERARRMRAAAAERPLN